MRAADGELKPHTSAETRQVIEPAGVAAMHAGCVVTAMGAGRRGCGDRQVDGEVLDISRRADGRGDFPSGTPSNSSGNNTRLRGCGFEVS